MGCYLSTLFVFPFYSHFFHFFICLFSGLDKSRKVLFWFWPQFRTKYGRLSHMQEYKLLQYQLCVYAARKKLSLPVCKVYLLFYFRVYFISLFMPVMYLPNSLLFPLSPGQTSSTFRIQHATFVRQSVNHCCMLLGLCMVKCTKHFALTFVQNYARTAETKAMCCFTTFVDVTFFYPDQTSFDNMQHVVTCLDR